MHLSKKFIVILFILYIFYIWNNTIDAEVQFIKQTTLTKQQILFVHSTRIRNLRRQIYVRKY